MRILMTTDTIGGVWTYSRELVSGLLKAGCHVVLVSMGRLPSPEQQEWLNCVSSTHGSAFTCVATEHKLEWMRDNASCYHGSKSLLLDLIDKYCPDLVHSNQFCYGGLRTTVPKIVVAHSDVLGWHDSCRGVAQASLCRSPWMSRYLGMVTAGLEGAAAVVTPTRWMLQSIEDNYGPLSATDVVPNGRAVPALHAARMLQAITAGRLWDEAKNIRMLEDVDSPMPILIAGEAEMGGETSFASSRLKVMGQLSEAVLLQHMAESAIYIATSRYEPFGLAPVEAALSGCAIVANDIPSLREVWADAAVYFHDAASLTDRLRELAQSPARLLKMAARAKKRATSEYSSRTMTSRYIDLYRRVIAANGKSCSSWADEMGGAPVSQYVS